MRIRVFLLSASVFAGLGLALDARAEGLTAMLACSGTTARMENETTDVTVTDNKDITRSASGKSQTWRVVRVPMRITLRFADGQGAVRWPPGGLSLSKRPPDGWYPLADIAVDDAAIRGKEASGLLRSKFNIDRRTGEISFGDFQGVCEKVADDPDARKF